MALTKDTKYEVLFKLTEDSVLLKKIDTFLEDGTIQADKVTRRGYVNTSASIAELETDLAAYPNLITKIKAFAGWT